MACSDHSGFRCSDQAGILKMAIESAMQAKDYEAAIQLALDGEDVDSQFRGLVHDWQKARYAAYKGAGQLDRQRELAMMFILDDEFESYLELKKTYDPKEWATIYPGIIQRFEKEKSWLPTTYTRILIEENEKERLLKYVQRNPSRIEAFAKYLLPDFREAVYDVFAKHIEQSAAEASNRSAYQKVCGIIRNLKKIGGSEQAKAIKEELLQTYQQRPALKDELSKL